MYEFALILVGAVLGIFGFTMFLVYVPDNSPKSPRWSTIINAAHAEKED